MFDAVPRRYDLLNRLLTLRLDERWRKRAATRCLEKQPGAVLDLCCGTGDLILQLAHQAASDVALFGLDYSPDMLAVARKKAQRAGRGVQLVEGDASNLPFAENRFDAVGIAFAFRNVTWKNPLRDAVLAEVHRVLVPGGRFVIVETSQPRSRVLRAGFRAYLRGAVAPVGTWLSGHRSAYRYLAHSARNFYTSQEVCDLLGSAGFESIQARRLMGGVAALHVAVVS